MFFFWHFYTTEKLLLNSLLHYNIYESKKTTTIHTNVCMKANHCCVFYLYVYTFRNCRLTLLPIK